MGFMMLVNSSWEIHVDDILKFRKCSGKCSLPTSESTNREWGTLAYHMYMSLVTITKISSTIHKSTCSMDFTWWVGPYKSQTVLGMHRGNYQYSDQAIIGHLYTETKPRRYWVMPQKGRWSPPYPATEK